VARPARTLLVQLWRDELGGPVADEAPADPLLLPQPGRTDGGAGEREDGSDYQQRLEGHGGQQPVTVPGNGIQSDTSPAARTIV
jgi:hypothetical protein